MNSFLIEIINELEPALHGVLFATPVFIISYATRKVLNSYMLDRKYKPNNISKVILPPELKVEYNELNIKNITSENYKNAILKFTNVLVNNFPKNDLNIFYNNIKGLSIKTKTFIMQRLLYNSRIVAFYTPDENKITINFRAHETTLYHELFHVASSIQNNRVIFSGFFQSVGSSTLGMGINEGYTELLTRRYFHDENYVRNSYDNQIVFAAMLEKIVGEKEMNHLYLTSNLNGLIKNLKNYTQRDEIMRFIDNTDSSFSLFNSKENEIKKIQMIKACYKEINRFLIICYARKMQLQGINYDCLKELENFISLLPSNLYIGKEKYKIIVEDEINKWLNEAFANTNTDLKEIPTTNYTEKRKK